MVLCAVLVPVRGHEKEDILVLDFSYWDLEEAGDLQRRAHRRPCQEVKFVYFLQSPTLLNLREP
jgi:hypothetical protein